MRVVCQQLIGRLIVRWALVVAALLAFLTPAMATAATTVVGWPLQVTTYDASTHANGGVQQLVRASSASDSRHYPPDPSWTAAAATPVPASAVGVATNTGSRLSEASAAAFRASENPSSIFIKNKHLASSGIRGGKFASDDIAEVQGWVAQGLRSDGVQFLPNQLDDTFRAIVPAGKVVGTGGQTNIRVIVTNDGRVINAFPVNVR